MIIIICKYSIDTMIYISVKVLLYFVINVYGNFYGTFLEIILLI
jgi:hypothetical protein